jgi:hypothetical protein
MTIAIIIIISDVMFVMIAVVLILLVILFLVLTGSVLRETSAAPLHALLEMSF